MSEAFARAAHVSAHPHFADATSAYHETADGTRLYYEVEGQGPIDFVLCDGIGCDGFIWRYLKPLLLERGRIIHMHMRGHGQSAAPANPQAVGIDVLAEDWRGLLDALDARQTWVLGHSMGVQVALELAHRDADRVQGLVLMCGAFENPIATFHDSTNFSKIFPALQAATRLGGIALRTAWRKLVALPVSFHVARMTELHPDRVRREDFRPYLEHLSKMDPKLFFEMLGGAARHSARHFLPTLDMPVLVIGGENDRFTPGRLSSQMCDLLPQGTSLIVAEGTHTVPIEDPMEVNLAVQEVLDASGFTPLAPA
jgi:pimeloyl-ACP methyl ester carboxylesterase